MKHRFPVLWDIRQNNVTTSIMVIYCILSSWSNGSSVHLVTCFDPHYILERLKMATQYSHYKTGKLFCCTQMTETWSQHLELSVHRQKNNRINGKPVQLLIAVYRHHPYGTVWACEKGGVSRVTEIQQKP